MLIEPSPMVELTYPADEIRMIGAAGKKSSLRAERLEVMRWSIPR